MSFPQNSLLSERLAVLGGIAPVALVATGTSTAISNWISANAPALGGTSSSPGSFLFGRMYALVMTGVNVASGVVTIQVYKGNGTSGGTTSATIYTTSYTGTLGSALSLPIDINLANAAVIDTTNNDIAVFIQGTANVPIAVTMLGGDPRYGPASATGQQQAGATNLAGAATPVTPTGY